MKEFPIHKSESEIDVNNYLPILILPTFSMILEKVITNRLINYLEKTLALRVSTWFRANPSSESGFIQFTYDVYNYLNKGTM